MKAEWIEIVVGAYGPDMKLLKLARRVNIEEFRGNLGIMTSITETMLQDFEEMTGKNSGRVLLG
jgi:hypothetical protein